MDMRLRLTLFVIAFPLLAFQCGQKWTKYAKNMSVEVNPKPIKLISDTISFQILIKPGYHKIKDKRVMYYLYAMTDEDWEIISTIEGTFEVPAFSSITKPLNLDQKVESLGLRFEIYHQGDLRLRSDILIVADIDDRR